MTTNTNFIQRTYRYDQQEGWPGMLARPYAPYAYDTGQIQVAMGAINIRPGEPVVYDATANRYRLPTSTEGTEMVGIVSYDSGTVATTGTFPATANSNALVEYTNDSRVKVGIMGTFYVIAGEALEYGQLVQWDASSTNTTYRQWIGRNGPDLVTAPEEMAVSGISTTLPSDDATWQTAIAAIKAAVDATFARANTNSNGNYRQFARVPMMCVSPTPVAAGDLMEVRVGWALR